MNLDLTGKTALVCGSTQGLGYASAVELAMLGANIILMARNEEKLQAAVKTLDESKGQKHQWLVADFTDPNNVKKAITNFSEENKTVHILVNNTGGPAGGTAFWLWYVVLYSAGNILLEPAKNCHFQLSERDWYEADCAGTHHSLHL